MTNDSSGKRSDEETAQRGATRHSCALRPCYDADYEKSLRRSINIPMKKSHAAIEQRLRASSQRTRSQDEGERESEKTRTAAERGPKPTY